ncbi:MAG: putative thymidylate kinase [Promethearchaeota archaeon]|nr:MAG: putative thymidylate kinase [Candidatus Lokiarchaeota archaeon]
MNKAPFFCVLDGIDGCGSTTHSKLLAGFLKNKGFKVHHTQEPTKNEIGELVRKFLKKNEAPPTTDALLFAADRDYHYQTEIKPKLEENYIVISDRYIESSIVYQSLQSTQISVEWVKIINKFVGKPNLTIILDIDPKISLARKSQQNLEKFENVSFLNKVRNAYLERAEKEEYAIINTDEIIEVVQNKIQKILFEHLNKENIF